MLECFVFFFKQKTVYDLRISDWSSDVCASVLCRNEHGGTRSATWMPDDVNVAQSNPRNWANVQTPPGVPRTSLGRYARSVRHQLQSACAFESGICPVRRPPDQAACPRKDSNGGWNPSDRKSTRLNYSH